MSLLSFSFKKFVILLFLICEHVKPVNGQSSFHSRIAPAAAATTEQQAAAPAEAAAEQTKMEPEAEADPEEPRCKRQRHRWRSSSPGDETS